MPSIKFPLRKFFFLARALCRMGFVGKLVIGTILALLDFASKILNADLAIKIYNLNYYLNFACFRFDAAFKCRRTSLSLMHRYHYAYSELHYNTYLSSSNLVDIRNLLPCDGTQHEIGSGLHFDTALIVGPNFTQAEVIEVDLVVLLKPSMPANIEYKECLLIINDSYFYKNTNKVMSFVNVNNITLKRTSDINLPFCSFGASLMGFQRALLFIYQQLIVKKIYFYGFNLNTGESLYNSSYPSLLPTQHKERQKAIHYSLARHDYLLNIFFTKMILSTPSLANYESDIDDLIDSDTHIIVDKMSKALQ